jgi:CBS domain-containing protein
MSPTVDSIDAGSTISEAARRMADDDIGALPVLSDGKLVGIVTDRDIAVRGVANHIRPDATIRRVMSENVATCGPEDDIETALALMSRERVRRMPVCDVDQEVIGIVTVGDAARHAPDKKDVAEVLAEICEPSGAHCQSAVLA